MCNDGFWPDGAAGPQRKQPVEDESTNDRCRKAIALSACSDLAPSSSSHGPKSGASPARIENTLGMKFVLVPAGTFVMGSDERPERLALAYPQFAREDLQALGDEAPRYEVRMTRAFYLGEHEVTVAQFRRFIERSGHVPESIADATGGYGSPLGMGRLLDCATRTVRHYCSSSAGRPRLLLAGTTALALEHHHAQVPESGSAHRDVADEGAGRFGRVPCSWRTTPSAAAAPAARALHAHLEASCIRLPARAAWQPSLH